MNLIEVLIASILMSITVLSVGLAGLQGLNWLKEAQVYTDKLIEIQNLRTLVQAYPEREDYQQTWQEKLKALEQKHEKPGTHTR